MKTYTSSWLFSLLLLTACTQEPKPGTQCTTKAMSPKAMADTPAVTYKEEIPKAVLQEEAPKEPIKQPSYFYDDTPVGSAVERDSGSYLNQQKRQLDMVHEIRK